MEDREGFRSFQGQHLSELEKKNQRSLREAIKSRNSDLVEYLIKHGTLPTSSLGTQINHRCTYLSYPTPLHMAVISRSPEIVKILLEAGANINLKDRIGDTPLTLAAKIGDNSIIDILLCNDVQNTKVTYEDLSHLHIACMRNKTDVVRKLLVMDQGRNVNDSVKPGSVFWAGYRPLHFAVHYGCRETVKLLLECGADITARDVKQMTPLHLADFQRNDEILDLLLTEHKHVYKNPINAEGISHFHISCTRDNPTIVEHFLKLGVNVNLESKSLFWNHWKPIHFATYYQCPRVVELLLEAGTYLGRLRFYNLLRIPLIIGNEEIYNLVSQRRTRIAVNHKQYKELTKLHDACIQDNTSEMRRLLSCDKSTVPNCNKPIWNGCTLAHLAAQCCFSFSTLKLLLDHGVNFMVQDAKGRTPLHIAFQRSKTWDTENRRFSRDVDKVIENIGTQNLTDNTGLSIFHILCTTNNVGLVNKFLSQGVDVNAQVGIGSVLWAGFTAIHFATQFLQYEVVTLLLKHGANLSIRNMMNLDPFDILVDKFDQCSLSHDYRIEFAETLSVIFPSRPRDVMECNMAEISPLHAICTCNRDLTVLQEFLVLYKDDINKPTNLPNSHRFNKCTALHFAMQRGLFDQAKMLLTNGADSYMVNSRGETPLESAAHLFRYRLDLPGAEYIFSLQTPIEIYKPSHFHMACLAGQTNVVTSLLNKAGDEILKIKLMNSLDDDGETPLHSVITNSGDQDDTSIEQIVHILLENGFDADPRDFQFQTPLHLAETAKKLEVMHTLLFYEADINAQNLNGQTPLHLLVRSVPGDNKERLALLLRNGADINIIDERGRSCLMERFAKSEDARDEEGDAEFDKDDVGELDEDDDAGQDSVECYVMLLEHVTKLRVIGFHISHKNEEAYGKLRKYYSEFFNEAAFICKCKNELECMRTIKIDSCTTLRDILFKSLREIVFYRNDILLKFSNSQDFLEKFPIYGYLIRLQLKKGRIRKPLLDDSIKSFPLLSRKSLPLICLDTIFQYLSNADLRNMLLSVNK